MEGTAQTLTRSHSLSLKHLYSSQNWDALSDPAFRGDATRYNPEELLVSALSACHMLWYLHLCAEAKIIVLAYRDQATGLMVETEAEGGHFQEVVLNPVVLIEGDADVAARLHERAHENCFIANSVNFPVRCTPTIQVASAQE